VRVEQLDQFGKVRQRARETVDLVNNNDINLACFYIGQQSLQRRPVGGAT
jgi:hypothetical protein